MPRPVSNPPNPWSTRAVEWLEEPPKAELQVFEEEARSMLSENDSPDVPFRFSANPYRGCQHACAYCYARNTHEYLDWAAGTDFDTKIVVKRNAAAVLRRELNRSKARGQWITFSGVTDAYQPLEASYELTKQCLEACLHFKNPVALITKSAIVRRDIELLQQFGPHAHVFMSIPFADDHTGRQVEPWASSISKRFETLKALNEAGIETGVAIAPIIPGLSEADVPAILQRASEVGTHRAFPILLRLPGSVAAVFAERMRAAFPDRAEKILSAQRQMHAGKLNDPNLGTRMSGNGPRWQVIEDLFRLHCRKLGFQPTERANYQPLPQPTQGNLF